MLKMDIVHVIRHKHFIEKQSVRGVARDMKIHRLTVKKYLEESEPKRVELQPRGKPIMDVVGPRIDALLEAWNTRLVGKHRITAARVHRQLREEGMEVSERSVRRYLAERRRKRSEVFIPLTYHPGEVAQVDYFEVRVEESGVLRKVWKFLMRLMYSGRDFVYLYDRCDQVSFLDAHTRAFGYFGGVPHRLVYDNLSAAVKRILLTGERELTERFQALRSHYLFEANFARLGVGHDKGGVESRGKSIRLQHMTPIVAGKTLSAISEVVLHEVALRWSEGRRRDGRAFSELFDEERTLFLPLPATAFETRALRLTTISSRSTVTIDSVLYSLPERWARLRVEAWIGAFDIRFCCSGEAVLRPRQRPGGRCVLYRDYLRELSRKPQAVRQVSRELTAEIGEPFQRLWALLEKTHGGHKAARIFAGLLGAIHDHGEQAVGEALEKALASGAFEDGGSGSLSSFMPPLPTQPVLAESVVPMALRSIHIESARAADYDQLAVRGGES